MELTELLAARYPLLDPQVTQVNGQDKLHLVCMADKQECLDSREKGTDVSIAHGQITRIFTAAASACKHCPRNPDSVKESAE